MTFISVRKKEKKNWLPSSPLFSGWHLKLASPGVRSGTFLSTIRNLSSNPLIKKPRYVKHDFLLSDLSQFLSFFFFLQTGCRQVECCYCNAVKCCNVSWYDLRYEDGEITVYSKDFPLKLHVFSLLRYRGHVYFLFHSLVFPVAPDPSLPPLAFFVSVPKLRELFVYSEFYGLIESIMFSLFPSGLCVLCPAFTH